MTGNQTGIAAGLKASLMILTVFMGSAAAIGTLVAFFGGAWWAFDLVANYRWQLMWVSLLAAIIYALTVKSLFTIGFLVAAVVNGFLIVPLWFGSQPPGTGEDGVRIVSVNLFGGSSDAETTFTWLFDSRADIILASGVTAERMTTLTVEGSPYQIISTPASDLSSGIVILARQALQVDTERTALEEEIFTVHVPSGDTTIDVITAWGALASNATKADLLAARLDTISGIIEHTPNAVAVIGDLGATRFTSGMKALRSSSGIRDATEGLGYLSTAPVSGIPIVGGWIGLPIDVVMMSEDITPLDLTTGPDIGVQHLPITVVVGPTAGS